MSSWIAQVSFELRGTPPLSSDATTRLVIRSCWGDEKGVIFPVMGEGELIEDDCGMRGDRDESER